MVKPVTLARQCWMVTASVALAVALMPVGCCCCSPWSLVGVVYLGSAVKAAPTMSAVSGDYRVRQYGGGSVKAAWPSSLVLSLREDGSVWCSGDHSIFVKDFGVEESAIDPAHPGRWSVVTGREKFPVGVELLIGDVTITADLLKTGDRFGLGISQAWPHADPDDRNTLEFLQDPPTPTD